MPKFRTELQAKLNDICKYVYYQPPESIKMVYPCIVYELDSAYDYWANDKLYTTNYRYSITLIDKDPDSKLFDKIRELPGCIFDRSFRSDNLNHFTFTLYYKN